MASRRLMSMVVSTMRVSPVMRSTRIGTGTFSFSGMSNMSAVIAMSASTQNAKASVHATARERMKSGTITA